MKMMPDDPLTEPETPAQQAPDLQDPQTVIDLFDRAAELSLAEPNRTGSCCELPMRGRLLMTGDVHDHGLNYQRIVALADLDADPDNHVILHEVIHGEFLIDGRDHSIRMLARVADLLVRYPTQVHVLLSNHELAQATGAEILKGGHSPIAAFDEGLDFIFDEAADDVRQAMRRYVLSMLMAVRCANGVFCSHSLPSPQSLGAFDSTIIQRIPAEEELVYGGSAYSMVWGRNHNEMLAEDLADDWGNRLFVMGHQPVDFGYDLEGESMLILNSDDNHGVALPIDLSKPYTDRSALVEAIIPLASVSV